MEGFTPIERPKPTDSQDDILEMQRKFIEAKSKDPSFRPSVEIKNMRVPAGW